MKPETPGRGPGQGARWATGPAMTTETPCLPECRCKCGADDFNGRPGRVGKTAVPHALNCPKRPAEPQGNEPPIDFGYADKYAADPIRLSRWDTENLARAYRSLKAERDALKAEIEEYDCPDCYDLKAENAALKARVERYEDLLRSTHKAISAHRHYYPELAAEVREIEARKEQKASL